MLTRAHGLSGKKLTVNVCRVGAVWARTGALGSSAALRPTARTEHRAERRTTERERSSRCDRPDQECSSAAPERACGGEGAVAFGLRSDPPKVSPQLTWPFFVERILMTGWCCIRLEG